MIPLRDNIPARRRPLMTVTIIIATTLVFIYQQSLPPYQAHQLLITSGIIPARVSTHLWSLQLIPMVILPLFSFMFLHGGWMHFLGNMWMLWIFGDNVEDRLGRLRFLAFYLVTGVLSGMIHILTNANSGVPTIGASGAIAGVMGAYLVLYPGARVLTLVPIFFFIQLVELPALIFLGFWFVLQLVMGLGSLGAGGGGIAWWAHIGGFLAGVYLLKTFMRPQPLRAKR